MALYLIYAANKEWKACFGCSVQPLRSYTKATINLYIYCMFMDGEIIFNWCSFIYGQLYAVLFCFVILIWLLFAGIIKLLLTGVSVFIIWSYLESVLKGRTGNLKIDKEWLIPFLVPIFETFLMNQNEKYFVLELSFKYSQIISLLATSCIL